MPYFVVIRERAAGWEWTRPMRRQPQWDAHAAYMDALVSDAFVVVGGPLGDENNATRVMHVVDAPDREAIEKRLAADPWTPNLLRTLSIEPWTVLLGALPKPRGEGCS